MSNDSFLPKTWEALPLHRLCTHTFGGGTPSTKISTYWNGDIPWTTTAIFRANDVYLNRFQRSISHEGLNNSSSQIAPKKSVLVGTRVGVGKSVVANFDVAINQDITALIPAQDIHPEYLALFIKQPSIQKWFNDNKRGSTIKGVPRADLLKIKVFVPTLNEQKAIANVLLIVNRAMEKADKVIAAARELKRSLMKHLFTYGPVPLDQAGQVDTRDYDEIGTFPSEWEEYSIEDAADLRYGYRTSIPKTPPPNGIHIISTAEITRDGSLNLQKLRTVYVPPHLISRYQIKQDDVLFNWRNAQELVGKTAIVQEPLPEPTVFASFIIRIRPKETLSPRFLHFFIYLLRERGVFYKQSRRAVNQANFNANELGALHIKFPPLRQQEQIVTQLDALEKKITAEQQRKKALETLFHSLLNELMTAKLRVDGLSLSDIPEAG